MRRCYECQTAMHPNFNTYKPMQSITAKEKGELLALDFLGPLPRSSRGVKHILVCVDVFTKAVQLYAIMPVSYTHLDVYKRQQIEERTKLIFKGLKTENPVEVLLNCEREMELIGSALTDKERTDFVSKHF